MKRILGGAALVAMMLPGFLLGEKKPQEPFYRRYLVPGNPLDDKILEQEKKVEADPKSAELRNDFGNLLAARRFPHEAREQYEMAMKLDKNNFLAPYNLGLLYETLGENGHAISAYEKSVDRNRGFPLSRFRLGRLYEKRGSADKAVEQYARALQIDPEMREPKRNPLIVDTQLLDRVSLENYTGDLAIASMASSAAFSSKNEAPKLPVDRALSSQELQPTPAPPPPGRPTPIKVIAPSTPPRREPVRPAPEPNPRAVMPPPTPTPDIVVLPPEPAEAQEGEQPTPAPNPFILRSRPSSSAPGTLPTPTPAPE